MAKGKTIAAGVSFGVGLFFWFVAIIAATEPNAKPSDQIGAAALGVLGGTPPIALGSWLLVNNRSRRHQRERDRLLGTFYRLLKENNGQINVLRFSMEANITGTEAKAFLDEQAIEFNATFNVDQEGKVLYYFDADFGTPPTLNASEKTYDIVLEFIPKHRQAEVLEVLQHLTGLSQSQVLKIKRNKTPTLIAENVTEPTAQTFRDRLERLGAKVLVVMR